MHLPQARATAVSEPYKDLYLLSTQEAESAMQLVQNWVPACWRLRPTRASWGRAKSFISSWASKAFRPVFLGDPLGPIFFALTGLGISRDASQDFLGLLHPGPFSPKARAAGTFRGFWSNQKPPPNLRDSDLTQLLFWLLPLEAADPSAE